MIRRWWSWPRSDAIVAPARHAVRDAVRRALGEAAALDAELCASELISNSVRYAGRGNVRVTLSDFRGGILCAVRDDGPLHWPWTLPRRRGAEHGRGLALVQGLADGLGVCTEQQGKVTFCWFGSGQ